MNDNEDFERAVDRALWLLLLVLGMIVALDYPVKIVYAVIGRISLLLGQRLVIKEKGPVVPGQSLW